MKYSTVHPNPADDANHESFMCGKGFNNLHGEVQSTDDWNLLGEDMQVLTFKVPAGSTKMTEPGTFLMSTEDVKLTITCDGFCSKLCTGENPMTAVLKNEGSDDGYIGLTPNYPANIIPISLREGGITAKKGAYMTSDSDIQTSCNIDWNPLTGCCSGLGCVRQGLSGEGHAFLNAGGTVLKKALAEGETVVVSTEGLVAWTEGVSLGVQSSGGCIMCIFSGEGLCNTTVTGPGIIYLHSMPLSKLKASLGTSVTVSKSKGEGGAPSSSEIER